MKTGKLEMKLGLKMNQQETGLENWKVQKTENLK